MSALCIAVSGLHRGENSQPGAGVIRSIRRIYPDAHIIALVYDAMESGIYAEGGPDEVQLMPYPSVGAAAFFQRLDALLKRRRIDIFIPTLDAEIELLVHLKRELVARGIRTLLPDIGMLRRRSKKLLPELAEACDIAIPKTRVSQTLAGACEAASELGLPVIVKGVYYDAKMAVSEPQVREIAAHLLSEWGAPVILQSCVSGAEFDVLGISEHGEILGKCSIRKTILSDKGKGMGGIVVSDERLDAISTRIIRELRWNGPFEIELIYDESREEYVLIEINPRFPAWIDFPAMTGANFAVALVDLILNRASASALADCPAGAFFLRHQIEVVGDISRYAHLLQDDSTLKNPLTAIANQESKPLIKNTL